jgi:RNA polymerase sigma-70 factor (ECF subfamily)
MMTGRQTSAISHSLNTLFRVGTLGSSSDRELLECISARPGSDSEDAFRVLVERHGPMVLGLCRSLIKDAHAAEDAFQATFLVLARKAGSIRRRDTIGPWLYGVASRVARKARARTARRIRWERPLSEELTAREVVNGDCVTGVSIIQEEVGRLPERLRGPLLLCCLQGMSYDGAARSLGLSEPALRGRLHRARKRLAAQLKGRGIDAAALGSLFEPSRFPLPSVSLPLIDSTARIALRWSSISVLSTGALNVPDSIATLAQGVTRIMLVQTYKVPAAGLLVGVGLLGTAVLAHQGRECADGRDSRNRDLTGAPVAQRDPQGKRTPQPDTKAIIRDIEAKYVASDLEAKTRQIRERLKQAIELNIENPTLEKLLKHIKQSTADTTFPGIPIYVDPVGLGQVHIRVDNPIALGLKGSVESVLSQTLRGLGLWYMVKDGFLLISSRDDITDRRLNELDEKLERVLEKLERLDRVKK